MLAAAGTLFLFASSGLPLARGQTEEPAPDTQAEETDASQPSAAQSEQTIRRLQTIKSVLEDRREQVRALLEHLNMPFHEELVTRCLMALDKDSQGETEFSRDRLKGVDRSFSKQKEADVNSILVSYGLSPME